MIPRPVVPRLKIKAPRWSFTAVEQLAVFEYGTLAAASPLLWLTPHGNGHPVLVFPGFGGSDRSTQPLRAVVRAKGYSVHGWRLGPNLGPHRRVARGVVERLLELNRQHQARVSLIGVSLGGIYAREIARQHPEAVRQVITLASPFRSRPGDRSAVSPLYELLAPNQEPFAGRLEAEEDRPLLPVPSTSLYTRTDGVVRWHTCIEAPGPHHENIEVRGTHHGLGVNIAALIAITDRLAQPEGGWSPFLPPRGLAHLFPSPAAWRPAPS